MTNREKKHKRLTDKLERKSLYLAFGMLVGILIIYLIVK